MESSGSKDWGLGGIQPKPPTHAGHLSLKSTKVIYWLSRFSPLLNRTVLRLKCLQTTGRSM